jgi:hypothetical protein
MLMAEFHTAAMAGLPIKVEAKGFRSFLKGQPRRATVAATLFRDKIEQLKS